ncbi:restriction endonuclease subunit S [Flavobacterium faecale]|nr:restriction endonuclease subunit S [Flavobacterium faecale]
MVKTGYKQTEIGLIPEDWEAVMVRDVVTINGRIGFRGYTIKDIVKEGYGAISLSPSNIKDGKINYKNCTYISWFKYEESPEIKIQNGDVILVKTGSTFGKSALVKNLVEKATLNPQVVVFKSMKINNQLFSYLVYANDFQNQIISAVVGGAIPTLSQEQIYNFQIPLPPLPEQQAIAEALSDADAWIESLEQLIAKKRLLKQGAMQELLSPKKDWEVRKLGDIILSNQLGGNYANSDSYNEYPLIKMGNIQRGSISLKKIEYISGTIPSKKDLLHFNDFLFNTRNTIDLVGKVSIWRNELPKAYFNSNLMRITFKPEFISSNVFMNAVFNSKYQIQKLKDIATGTTSVAAIYTRDLLGLEIYIPNKKEQTRIGTILSDMDLELEALMQQLEKARQIKQGMMQELLTGRIRLI